MTRCWRILLGVLTLAVPMPAMAQSHAPAPAPAPAAAGPETAGSEAKTREQLEAQQHFQRARELYQTGAYRDAVTELEQARALDPKAKDLAFNLGVVHEKLGNFDEAIGFFRLYIDMATVTAAERAKAETVITRIEGAKRTLPVAPSPNGAPTPAEQPAPAPAEVRAYGRVDAATVVAASVAIVGLGVGTTFGVLALSNKPSSFVTGRDGTYDTLQAQASDAHAQAIVADVGFGVGIVAAVTAAYLYLGRAPAATAPRSARQALAASRGAIEASAAPLPSGGFVAVGGSFR